MATNPLLLEFLQFMSDLPFAQIGTAVASGGTNVVLDVGAAEAIVAAAVKDFFTRTVTVAAPDAPATTAAITAATVSTPAT